MKNEETQGPEQTEVEKLTYYRVQFRPQEQHFTASSSRREYSPGAVVMVATDHGLEPVSITGTSPLAGCGDDLGKVGYPIERTVTEEELTRLVGIRESEQRAHGICNDLIEKHKLIMNLVRVERFFNGSKMIFYFTADSRVDFRGLVKDLVREFRTRVEMRQVGVRHETKMVGGVGCCGRELCCSSFIKKFDSVSIKMAKEQDLPLNPTKISGLCNRLLCCLTYEYDSYKEKRRRMPKAGRRILVDNKQYQVKRQLVLQDSLLVMNGKGEESVLSYQQWKGHKPVKKKPVEKKKKDRNNKPES